MSEAARILSDSEAEVINSAIAGDSAAQRQLMAEQRVGVHHTLYRILGSNRDMEDLMQDTFIEVFRALSTYRGESSLRRWCSIIATRTAWRYLDRAKRRPRGQELVDIVDDSSSPASRLDASRAVARLYAVLDRLEPSLRITYALAVIDDLPMAEIAELTSVSVMAVKTRLWRARGQVLRRAAKDDVLAPYLARLDGGAS